MEFIVMTGKKEMDVCAQLLREKDQKKSRINFLFLILASLLILSSIYLRIVEQKGFILIGFLIILAVACTVRAFVPIEKDYSKIVNKRNQKIQKEHVIYRFYEDGIEAATRLSTNRCKWKKCLYWGELYGCIYITLKGGQVIVIDQEQQSEKSVAELKEMLHRKIGLGEN